MTVVEVRSYSLISGRTSDETLSGRCGALRLTMSRSIASCTGLVKELSRQIAIASTFSASSASTARSASAGGSARSDTAALVDAFVDHLAQVALDQRHRLGPGEVVELGHAQGADFQHVAEALGGD